MASLLPLRIGLVGAGTVGGGVYEIIMNLAAKAGRRPCVITKICVRDVTKPRSFVVDATRTELVTNVDSILMDDSIDLVVEVMGGTGLAKTVVESALQRGKSVVTANKALIADHLDDIHKLAKDSNACFAFEAAVCGGIPIIQTLYGAYTGDTIHEVMVSLRLNWDFVVCRYGHVNPTALTTHRTLSGHLQRHHQLHVGQNGARRRLRRGLERSSRLGLC
jgi:homoserine dehydrogenase